MKCPGCGADVENEHVAHYPPTEPEPEPEPEPNAAGPEPEPEPEAKPVPASKRSGFDFSTQLFDDEGD